MKEQNAYILGTDFQELHRLGIQHQVWASEAQRGWQLANFNAGQTLLDLGCGPGFCTKELAFVVGEEGKVIGIDRSEHFIQFLDKVNTQYGLNIEAFCSDFDDMELEAASLDGMYCRWALAWIPNPMEVLLKVKKALKPGGKMVIHEYYDWSTHQTQPGKVGLKKAISAVLRSFKDQDGEIDIGKELPAILSDIGMKVSNIRMMTKLPTVDDLAWQWPKSFYKSYYPRLVDSGYLTNEDVIIALKAINDLEKIPNATIFCPSMVEIIAEKI